MLYTKEKKIAFGKYTRVVGSTKGIYFEFEDLEFTPIIKPGEEWRKAPKYKNCKYLHLIHPEEPEVKIYQQLGKVSYADYLPGNYYVEAKHFIMTQEDLEATFPYFVWGTNNSSRDIIQSTKIIEHKIFMVEMKTRGNVIFPA